MKIKRHINISQFVSLLFSISLLAAVLTIQGCATYGDELEQAKTAAATGDYAKARDSVQDALKPTGDDALLYYMELGMLEHLDKHYDVSNHLLTQAEQVADELYTRSAGDLLQVLMTNPRSGPYRGSPYELVLINYVKALNYLFLADQAVTSAEQRQQLDNARVEVRRANIRLQDIEQQKGDYQQAKDEQGSLFNKLMQIYAVLNAGIKDREKLIYRQDAWVNYLSGVSYEKNGEWDDARISYEKSARLYEDGFQQQYELSPEITEQAWFDAIRMMKKSGWSKAEWQKIADKKLSAKHREQLLKAEPSAQLLLIEDAGNAPEIGEMNLIMYVRDHSLILRPVPVGTDQQQNDQFNWFFMLYADKGILNLVQNYNRGGVFNSVDGFFSTQNFGILPMYPLAQSIGLIPVLSANPVRVTVPYMAPLSRSAPKSTQLHVDGQQYVLWRADSIAHMAFYQRLLHAGREIQLAVARESVKAIMTYQAAAATDDKYKGLVSFAANIVAASLSKAETRSWLLLPYEVRMQRLWLEPGQHTVKLNGGSNLEQTIDIQSNDIAIIKHRSFQ